MKSFLNKKAYFSVFSTAIFITALFFLFGFGISDIKAIKEVEMEVKMPQGNYIDQKTGRDIMVVGDEHNLTDSTSQEEKGYIVQFEEPPILVKKKELKKKAEENKKYVEKSFILNPISLWKRLFSTMPEDVNKKVGEYREKLQKQNNKLKQDILDRITKKRLGLELGQKKGLAGFFSKLTAGLAGLFDIFFPKKPALQHKFPGVLNEFKNVFNGIALDISKEEAEDIKIIKGVKSVSPNLEVKAMLNDSVPLINADGVWQLDRDGNNCSESGKECLTGKGVTIGIIDTGIDYTHEDLGGCFGEECKVISGYDFVNNDNDPMDDHGHGTHVAGIAAGNGALKGVAPDAKLYAYKVLDYRGGGYSDDIIAAIDRTVDLNENEIPCENEDDYVDVISLSLGGSGNPDDPKSRAIDNAALCTIPVVAAGNSGPSEGTIKSPGTSRKAITVGATDKSNNIASFSSRGPVRWVNGLGESQTLIKPDIIAPGVGICSAQYNSAWNDKKCLDDKHIAISGTSMATPHVAGAAALLKQKNPNWTPEEIKIALRNTAVEINEEISIQGHGRLDILGTINFKGIPSIAKIETGGIKFHEMINIKGTAKGKEFNKYILYYRTGDDPEWHEIITEYSPVEDNILYSNFDTSLLNEGVNYLKLAVWNSNGEISEDINEIFVITELIEKQITTDPSAQGVPKISGDKIVWEDFRDKVIINGQEYSDENIYMYDLSTNQEKQITYDPNSQMRPFISGDKIVWEDFRDKFIIGGQEYSDVNIYMYGLSTNQEKQITTNDEEYQTAPSISGDKITWEDNRMDIYWYDLSLNQEKRIMEGTEMGLGTSISDSGDKIVWESFGTIFAYNLINNQKKEILTDSNPNVWLKPISASGDKIVWGGYKNRNWDIYMYDLSTNEEKQITTDPYPQKNPSISGNKIVWEDHRYGSKIYIYDLLTGEEKQLTPYPSTQGYPHISGNRVVWHDYRNGNWDIYMYELPPECLDECSNGETRCDGNIKQICGNYDEDSCLEWGGDVDCGEDTCDDWQANFCEDNDVFKKRACYDKGCSDNICFNNSREEEELVQDCGENSCGDWGKNYCKEGAVYHSKTCQDRGCSDSVCFNNSKDEEEKIQECPSKTVCFNGECVKCADSDGGINIYEKGIVEWEGRQYTDRCIWRGNRLIEYYCENERLKANYERCQNGCYDGACKQVPSIEQKLLAHYLFDGNANDSVGSYNGTIVGAPQFVSGVSGQGLKFDGIDDYVQVANHPDFEMDYTTITAWVYPEDLDAGYSGYQGVAGQGFGKSYMMLTRGGVVSDLTNESGQRSVQTKGTLEENKWQFIAISHNGTSKKIYINGNLVGHNLFSGKLQKSSEDIILGSVIPSQIIKYPAFFKGSMDELKIYNYALTDAEILSEYDANKPEEPPTTPQLLAHYSFEDNANDVSGSNNHGIVYGNPATTTGKVGQAYNFDGTNDYIYIPHTANSVKEANKFSVSAWIKPNLFRANSDYDIINYDLQDRDTTGWRLRYEYGALVFRYGNFTDKTNYYLLQKDKWYLVTLTFDNGNVGLYIDGELKKSAAHNSTITYDDWNRLFIGKYPGNGYYWRGIIDEVKFWNYALDRSQIREEYSRGIQYPASGSGDVFFETPPASGSGDVFFETPPRYFSYFSAIPRYFLAVVSNAHQLIANLNGYLNKFFKIFFIY